MCGIVGYVGHKNPLDILVDGLRRMEYRGYDSAGVALGGGGTIHRVRASGKIANLAERLRLDPPQGSYGLGHTRWATHGRPTEENAHPHTDCSGNLVVVHNGIIENHLALRDQLQKDGHHFVTETDTEVIAHLVETHYTGDLTAALRDSAKELRGIFAVAVIHAKHPDLIVAARNGPPLVVGLGQDEQLVASDIPAILPYTREMLFLDDGEIATVRPAGVEITDLEGHQRSRQPEHVPWDPIQAEKAGYKHFMLKEIYEQPQALRDTLLGRLSLEQSKIYLDEMGIDEDVIRGVPRIQIVACGTSWHAGLAGRYFIEDIAKVPCEVDYGSEFRYRDPLLSDKPLVILLSQSGETADTLAALREAKAKGCPTLAICNVVGSMLTRVADGTLYTHAGPEIGVASTKAFTTQLAALGLLALYVGQVKGTLDEKRRQSLLRQLHHLPSEAEIVLGQDEKIAKVARRLAKAHDFLFLGRGSHFPIALEGALKLKEISYIHAEGYPAGEMKHGPIALIEEGLPVVALAPMDHVHEKILANIEEVKARDAFVFAIGNEGDEALAARADFVISIPTTAQEWTPILSILPLQLLAYHIAIIRGCDVDQPRNLAKSVTVE